MCQVDCEVGVVAKEGCVGATEDAAVFFAEVEGISRACPRPLDREGKIVGGEGLLDDAWAEAVLSRVEVLGRLGDDGRGFEVWGRGFQRKTSLSMWRNGRSCRL